MQYMICMIGNAMWLENPRMRACVFEVDEVWTHSKEKVPEFELGPWGSEVLNMCNFQEICQLQEMHMLDLVDRTPYWPPCITRQTWRWLKGPMTSCCGFEVALRERRFDQTV